MMSVASIWQIFPFFLLVIRLWDIYSGTCTTFSVRYCPPAEGFCKSAPAAKGKVINAAQIQHAACHYTFIIGQFLRVHSTSACRD
jgi:hypothetical protein